MRKLLPAIILFIVISAKAQVHIGPGQTYNNIYDAFTASAIQPGDTVYCHGGIYTGGWQGIQNLNGDADHWITITRYQNEAMEINGCWQFMSCSFIKFENLTFKANVSYPGRHLNVDNSGDCATQSHHIVIDSCYFLNETDAGASAAVKFGGVDSFEVRNCVISGAAVEGWGFNVCHHGSVTGCLFENMPLGAHCKGGALDIRYERNTFKNCYSGWGFEIGGDTGAQFFCSGETWEAKDIHFYSNIFIDCYNGLDFFSAVDCDFRNNTIYNTTSKTLRGLCCSSVYPTISGNVVENNIFAFGSTAYMNASTLNPGSISFNKNIYYSIVNGTFSGPYWDPEWGTNTEASPMIYGNTTPMFVDGAGGDFHLVVGSPAIASGVVSAEPVYDYYGNPYAYQRSIGASEYNDATGLDEETGTVSFATIYPNPASKELNVVVVSTSELERINIYNTAGTLIYNAIPTTKAFSVNTSAFENGIYFISLECSNKETLSKTFIITK